MADRLTRAIPADLEVRAQQRTIFGLAVPFDAPTDIRELGGGYTEVFRRGAFTRTIQERGDKVKLLTNHDGHERPPIGRATLLREDAASLYSEFRVSKTPAGDEVLELVADRALDAFSIGFVPVRANTARDGTVERTEVSL